MKQIFILIGFFLNLWSDESVASLPYIGPEAKKCDVIQPGQGDKTYAVDAGYVSSEDCSVIYIKPPAAGKIIWNQFTSNPWDEPFCDAIGSILLKLSENVIQRESKDLSIEKVKQLVKEFIALRKELDSINKESKFISGSLAGLVDLQWNQLVTDYKYLNPDKDIRELPITAGVLSTGLYSNSDILNESEEVLAGVKGLSLHGTSMPSEFSDDSNMPVPEFFKKLEKQEGSLNVLMSHSVGMTLHLNLTGMCSFLKKQNYAMASTYTYFFPVQTKSTFRVTINDKQLEKDIFSIIQAKGGYVTVEELFEKVNGTKSVLIEMNEGVTGDSDEARRLEKEYKESLISLVLKTVLDTVSSQSQAIIERAAYTIFEERHQISCRRAGGLSGLFGGQNCTHHRYFVPIRKIDWAKVGQQLGDLVRDQSGGVSSYKTFYMMGTSALVSGPTRPEGNL